MKTKTHLRVIGILLVLLVATSCESSGANGDLTRSAAQAVLEKAPVLIVTDVVAVSDAQFDCAVKAGSFFVGPDGSYQETPKGRGLGYLSPRKPDFTTDERQRVNSPVMKHGSMAGLAVEYLVAQTEPVAHAG